MLDPFIPLRDLLTSLQDALILSKEEVLRLIPLLRDCWPQIPGGYDNKMSAIKLDRMEKVEWDPPNLSFTIERHGATVYGSSRAELHQWTINVDKITADCYTNSYRQLYKTAKRLNIKPCVAEIYQLIKDEINDDRLKWSEDGRQVTVNMTRALDKAAEEQNAVSGHEQTEAGRRKRFKELIIPKLEAIGWCRISRSRLKLEKKYSKTL